MTDADPLAAFDDDVISAVADANSVELPLLREALTDHQRTMRENPGVENLVYEWRKRFADPLLLRTDAVFVVAVPPTVWREFESHLDIDPDVFTALTAAHQEQTLRSDADLSKLPTDHAALVLTRP